MEDLNEAFEDLVKDMYNAEKQLIAALPKMAKKTTSPELKKAIETHLEETKDQASKLEEVAKACGFKPTGVVCKAMKGLVEEADEHLSEGKPSPVLDAVIIACAQKVEHYEIANYGTARTWAKQLGFKEAVPILQAILEQESATDEKLSKLAESSINQKAEDGEKATPKTKVSVR